MKNLFGGLFGGARRANGGADAISSALRAMDASAAERALPTLVCRTCSLKYENTGTYLQGSRCPRCFPNG